METDHRPGVLAGFPERVVTAVVVRLETGGDRGDQHASQAVIQRKTDFLDAAFRVPQQRTHGHTETAHRIERAKLRQPAVMGAGAGPLEIGHDVLGGQRKAGAEGWGVLLRDAVGEHDLAGDAVGVEHFGAPRMVPCPRELGLDACPPLLVDVLQQKHLFGLVGHVLLDGQHLVERFPVLRIEICPVALRREPRMAVGRNNGESFHLHCLLVTRRPCRPRSGCRRPPVRHCRPGRTGRARWCDRYVAPWFVPSIRWWALAGPCGRGSLPFAP